MRRDAGDAGRFRVRLDELPDDLLPEPFVCDAVGAIHGSENVILRYIWGSGPRIDRYLNPRWHRRGADPAVLANEVHDAGSYVMWTLPLRAGHIQSLTARTSPGCKDCIAE